jgi:hypothetical protein
LVVTKQQRSRFGLIFNCTHQRQGRSLFPGLLKEFVDAGLCLDRVIFTTNDPFSQSYVGDLVNNMVDPDPEQKTQQDLKTIFLEMASEYGLCLRGGHDSVIVVKSVDDSLVATRDCDHVLITGSLHLVGSALTVFNHA